MPKAFELAGNISASMVSNRLKMKGRRYFRAGCLVFLAWMLQEPTHALVFTLRTDKAQYIQFEPVRLLGILENDGDQDFTIGHPPSGTAATVEYYRIYDDGRSEKLGTSRLRAFYLHDVPGSPIPFLITWTIRAKSTYTDHLWIDQAISQGFGTGKIRLSAVFKPQQGSLKGIEMKAEATEISIASPTGADLTAYKFLTRPLLQGVQNGLVMNSGSHLSRADHESILGHVAESAYANYFRYTMATYLNVHEEDRPEYEKQLREIVDTAPFDFPLLGNAYAMLLYYYNDRRELEKMFAISQKFRATHPAIADPDAAKRVADLIKEIEWWPPKTRQQSTIAGEAELTLRARALSEKYWLARDLEAVYRAPRQSSEKPNYAEKWFYNPKSSWFDTVKFLFGPDEEPKTILFHGSLETFCVGRLGDALAVIKQKYALKPEQALKVFVEAVIEGDSACGRLEFPDKKEMFFALRIQEKTALSLDEISEKEIVLRKLEASRSSLSQGILP